MGKCRYNLSEECHNKDCVKCILEKIKAEIEEYRNCIPWDKECLIKFEAINYIYENIIWKYISELKGE